MVLRPIAVLAAAAASVLFLRPALAQTPGMTNGTTPQNGWSLPVPPTGWGGIPPTGSSAMTGNDHDHGDHGEHHHHQGTVIVTWPFPYYPSGYSTTSTQPIVINVQAPPQPAPQPTGPPPPVPGVDTHPTVEQTPSGVEIVRGPGSS